jgi:hypothetical protein
LEPGHIHVSYGQDGWTLQPDEEKGAGHCKEIWIAAPISGA